MKTAAFSLLVLTLTGCMASQRLQYVGTPASHPDAESATPAPMPRALGIDPRTQKTNDLLAAAGANDLEGLKPMQMEGMDHSEMGGGHQGMDHSKMHGTPGDQPQPERMKGMDHSSMDHSNMPGMKAASPTAAPNEKKEVTEEMKKLADEMKKTADELKKAEDAKKTEKPATEHSKGQHGGHTQKSVPSPQP